MRVKICYVLGDIMQASVLAILLLRSDLRVRGALINLRKMNLIGGKSDDGGTQGNDNYLQQIYSDEKIQEPFSLFFSLGSSFHLPSDFASSAKATNKAYSRLVDSY